MCSVTVLVLCSILSLTRCVDLNFPPGFKFGVATSAYQIEGAWNVSDKSESICDRFTHSRGKNEDRDNADLACDSYHLWKRDIEMLEELGVHYYRFSISWSRLLPTGFTNKISEDGCKYYNDLIDGLLAKGIEPVVTLYHLDLPQKLQDLGGWINPLISQWFADYARVVFSLYGDRVTTWITINEPAVICEVTYNTGDFPPGILNPEVYPICGKNVLMAHAKAWRIYDEEFRSSFNGRVALCNDMLWMKPAKPELEHLTELVRQHLIGRFSQPIYSEAGGWPAELEQYLNKYNENRGKFRSLLPTLSKEEIDLIKGTYDFYAFNMYTSRVVERRNGRNVSWPLYGSIELDAYFGMDPNWKQSAVSYFPVYPEGMRKQLKWLKETYGNIPMFIAENGFANNGGLNDTDRIECLKEHMRQILLSIKEDGVNVTAYTVWSLMDVFEWTDGYSNKFGLYEVDFSSPLRTRTPRASALYYASVIKNNSLDVPINITVRGLPPSGTVRTSSTNYLLMLGVLLLTFLTIVIVTLRVRRRRRERSYERRKDSYISVSVREGREIER